MQREISILIENWFVYMMNATEAEAGKGCEGDGGSGEGVGGGESDRTIPVSGLPLTDWLNALELEAFTSQPLAGSPT